MLVPHQEIPLILAFFVNIIELTAYNPKGIACTNKKWSECHGDPHFSLFKQILYIDTVLLQHVEWLWFLQKKNLVLSDTRRQGWQGNYTGSIKMLTESHQTWHSDHLEAGWLVALQFPMVKPVETKKNRCQKSHSSCQTRLLARNHIAPELSSGLLV